MEKINKKVPIVSTILKPNQAKIDAILEGNAATLADMHSLQELTNQKNIIHQEYKDHMISDHRGNLDDTCGKCNGFRTDMYIHTRAIEIRRKKDIKINKNS